MSSRWYGALQNRSLPEKSADTGKEPASGSVDPGDECETLDTAQAEETLAARDLGLDLGRDESGDEDAVRVVDIFSKHLLAEIEHDLRTPLAALRMNVGLLLDKNIGDLNENQRGLAEYAYRDIDRLVLLLDLYIGLFSQPADMVREIGAVDLSAVLQEATESVKIIADIRKIDLRMENGENPPPPVKADRQALYRVLETLVLLSLKISRKNRTMRLQQAQQGGELVLSIVIQEPAPSVEEVRRVFQLPQATAEKVEGIQFARRAMLRTCRKILLQMEGELAICSFGEEDSGFKVSLKTER